MGISAAMGPDALRAGVVDDTAGRPASPFEGQLIFQKDTNQLLIWDGSAWVMIGDTDAPPALQLIKTQTVGNGVSSETVSDVFSNEFSNYRVVISNVDSSANDTLNVQIGTITTGVYYGNWSYAKYDATAFNVNPVNAQTSMVVALTSTDANLFCTFDLANPNVTLSKFLTGSYFGRGYAGTFSGEVVSATAQTSLKIIAGAGTLTGGTIRVYGYRN